MADLTQKIITAVIILFSANYFSLYGCTAYQLTLQDKKAPLGSFWNFGGKSLPVTSLSCLWRLELNSTTKDVSDLVLPKLSSFAVGLVKKIDGSGSGVLGSGTLVSIEGRHGILTGGHVAEAYKELPELGLINFSITGLQRRVLKLEETQTIILQPEGDWSEKGFDLAFTLLPPEIASAIQSQNIFVNIEKNRTKMEAVVPFNETHADVMLGLIAEFSKESFIEGQKIVSPMRAVLHTGHAHTQEHGVLVFDAMDYNLNELPSNFGGMSGAGVWRIYFAENHEGTVITKMILCGVASWQIDDRKIACQSWDRIDQALIPAIRKNLQF